MNSEPRHLVHELTMKAILAYIGESKLRPGQKLPAEREIAKRLQVSRGTVREAYRSLAARGILSSYHGRGTFLAALRPQPANGARPPNLTDATNIISLAEARQVLECGAITFAVQRATPADFVRLSELIEKEETAPELDANGAVLPSTAFEIELVRIAGNPLLLRLEEEVAAAWVGLFRRLGLGVLNPKARSLDHREILDAIREGNVRLAQKALAAHINGVALLLKKPGR
jgi:GntR family transcriptional repressor for pyruvate dehydrogenase complex